MLISSSFLKGIFVGFIYSWLKELLCFIQHFKVVTRCFLVCVVSDKKSTVILTLFPLYVMCLFFPWMPQDFLFVFFFLRSLMILCLGGCAGGWIWVFFIYLSWYSQPLCSGFQNSQPLILQIILLSHSLSLFLWAPSRVYVRLSDVVPQLLFYFYFYFFWALSRVYVRISDVVPQFLFYFYFSLTFLFVF